jgi:hypothetical protein
MLDTSGLLCNVHSRLHAWKRRARDLGVQARHWRAKYFRELKKCDEMNDDYMIAMDAMVAMNADCFVYYPSVLKQVQRRAEEEADMSSAMTAGFYQQLYRQHVHESGHGTHHVIFEI